MKHVFNQTGNQKIILTGGETSVQDKDNSNYTVGEKYGKIVSFNRVHHKHQMICQSRHLSPEHKHSMLEFSSPSH